MADEFLDIARAVSDSALATEGVHSLGGGTFVEAATYGPGGEKVSGVVVKAGEVEVHVVAKYPPERPLPALAATVRERATPFAKGRSTNVVIEDLAAEAGGRG